MRWRVGDRETGEEVERQLRESGAEFINAHDRTEAVIRTAANAGMSEDAIARVSGLAPGTVAAFLHRRQSRT